MNEELKERFADYNFLEKITVLKETLMEIKNNCDVPTEMENKLINESIVLITQWQEILDNFEEQEDLQNSFCYMQLDKKELYHMVEFLINELEKSLYLQFHIQKLIEYKFSFLN